MVIMKKTQQELVKLVIQLVKHVTDKMKKIVILAQKVHSSMKDSVLLLALMDIGPTMEQILVTLVIHLVVLVVDQKQLIVTLVALQQQILIFKMTELVFTHAHLPIMEEILMDPVNHAIALA